MYLRQECESPAISVFPWASLLFPQVSVSCSFLPADVSPAPLSFFSPPPGPAYASPSPAPAQRGWKISRMLFRLQTASFGPDLAVYPVLKEYQLLSLGLSE